MSDQSLRDALEELTADLRSQPHDPDSTAVTVMRHVGAQLAGLLAAHPAEPAPVVTDEAVRVAANAFYQDAGWEGVDELEGAELAAAVRGMRTALEAAAPLLGPRSLLNRDDVCSRLVHFGAEVRGRKGAWQPATTLGDAVDAVMELARPMPTREQIATALDPTAFVARKDDASYHNRRWLALRDADTVLALLNGSGS